LLKFKVEETADLVVVGIAELSEGTFWRAGLVLASSTGDGLRYVGRVGVGAEELAVLDAVLPELRRASAPCVGAGKAVAWLEPAIVCEVVQLGRWVTF
jgi:ATP-dependent DNA ligase